MQVTFSPLFLMLNKQGSSMLEAGRRVY